MGRPRMSTLALVVAFLLTLALYLLVRPDPSPPTEQDPATHASVTTRDA